MSAVPEGFRVRVCGDSEPAMLQISLPKAGEGEGVAGRAALDKKHLDGVLEGGVKVHIRAGHKQGHTQGRGHRGHTGTCTM